MYKLKSKLFGNINLLVSALSILGIYSAYMYGLTSLFGFGARNFVDAKFISNSIFSVSVFFVSSAAIIRFSTLFAKKLIQPIMHTSGAPNKIKKSTVIPTWLRAAMIVALLLSTLFTNFITLRLLMSPFLDRSSATLILGIFFATIAISLFLIIFTERNTILELFNQNSHTGSPQYHKYIMIIASRLHKYISLVIAFLLVMALMLGLARFHSLTNARPLCIHLDDEIIIAPIIGETSSGIFFATRPVGIYERKISGSSVALVGFIPMNSVRKIDVSCSNP